MLPDLVIISIVLLDLFLSNTESVNKVSWELTMWRDCDQVRDQVSYLQDRTFELVW